MKFYTHHSVVGDQIFIRGIDEDGNRTSEYKDVQPEFFLTHQGIFKDPDVTSIFGDPVRRVSCDGVYDFRTQMKEYLDVEGLDVLGTNSPNLQYVVNNFHNQDAAFVTSQIRRLNIDIETEVEVSKGFPDIDDPVEVINIISAYDSLRKTMFVFHTKELDKDWWGWSLLEGKFPLKFKKCVDEADLLGSFVKFWEMDYPDVLSGWNIAGFDVPYTCRRIEKVLGKSSVDRLSPVGSVRHRKYHDEQGMEQWDYTIQGVEIVDTLQLYKKIVLDPRESYSLEFIAMHDLKVGKLQHPSGVAGHKLYKQQNLAQVNLETDWGDWQSHKRLVEDALAGDENAARLAQSEFEHAHALYNVMDVWRCFQIEEVLDLFSTAYFLSYSSYSNISEVMSGMRVWSNLLYGFSYKDLNKVYPFNKRGHKTGKFTGAFVRPTKVGKYQGMGCIVSYDVASMYPSLIRTLNISPEKLTNRHLDITVDELLGGLKPAPEGYSLGANGATFFKDEQGVLPKKVEELFAKRKQEKKKLRAVNEQIAEVEVEMEKRGLI